VLGLKGSVRTGRLERGSSMRAGELKYQARGS